MQPYFHSVALDIENCKGCTICIKHCPTEAIRVRDGKARILETRCIDCGECIKICPNHAKIAIADDFDALNKYAYTVALPAPSFFGQFQGPDVTVGKILQALLTLGFTSVYEVAKAAEHVSLAVRRYVEQSPIRPLISSACPAVVRLIQVRFPDLIEHLVPIQAPVDIAARFAKEDIMRKYDLKPEQIGAFFITPCPAKVTALRQPIGLENVWLDGAIPISTVYAKVLRVLPYLEDTPELQEASALGLLWGRASGEEDAVRAPKQVAVDGIRAVIDVLGEIEIGKFHDVDFIECQACRGGCVGGALTVQNPFLARVNLERLAKELPPESSLQLEKSFEERYNAGDYGLELNIEPRSILKLDDDFTKAIEKMELLEKTVAALPGLDCGSCGSPSCQALAEDIVQGLATEADCVFVLRDGVQSLAEDLLELARRVPGSISHEDEM
ncbi:MAG: 4Fe-4S dicluster domain-containing protein [Firmicutes bacterium]|nr:4Fe-4S dicluster domain-containing protein [Bacillota bacterium]